MLTREKKIAAAIALAFAAAAAGTSVAIWQGAKGSAQAAITAASAPGASRHAGNYSLGDRIPDFTVHDREGEAHTLVDLRATDRLTALITHSPDCPCAANCGKLVNDLIARHGDQVKVVGIMCSDTDNSDVLERLDEQIAENVITFPVYFDHDQSVKKLLGATRTPEVWLLDKEGRIVYYGAPENTLFPGTKNHRALLTEAVEAVAAGRKPEIERFDPIGCLIGE